MILHRALKPIQIHPTHQPNRVLRDKPPKRWFIITQKVVVQTGFLVEVLVLQAEWLVHGPLSVAVAVVNKLSPRVITPFPNEFALAVGHLSRHADLVAVEVVDGMFGIIAFFVTLRQRLIAVGMGVNVGKSAVGFCAIFPLADFLHQVRARPDKLRVALFFAFLVQLGFRNPSA